MEELHLMMDLDGDKTWLIWPMRTSIPFQHFRL